MTELLLIILMFIFNGVDRHLHKEAGALKELYDCSPLALIYACGL